MFRLGSILILFCLSAERFFDQKYLHPASERPKWGGLTLDLAVRGTLAGIFVVLANSFQPLANRPFKPDDLYKDQLLLFVLYLAILYGVDVVCLALQCITLRGAPVGSKIELLYRANLRWFFTNLILTVVFSLSYKFSDQVVGTIGVVGIAIALVLIHAVRFAYDFGGSFDFYYPKEEMPDGNELLNKPA